LQEIVKENDIYHRERLVNLNLFAYLAAKILILAGLASLQTFAMVTVIVSCFAAPEAPLLPWLLGLTITSYLTLFTAMGLGLTVSAIAKNSTQANTTLPILLLPQIIFSGVLFKIKGIGQYLSWLMTSRWSVGAYGALVDINRLVPEAQVLPDGTLLDLPFQPSDVYTPTWRNLMLNWEMLMLQGLVFLVINYITKRRQDII
jgi:putative ABC transport system ATP-binding protein